MSQDNSQGYYPGDATPEDIPNPDPSVMPGDQALPVKPHETTGFSDVPNFDGVPMDSPHKRAKKDSSAYDKTPSPTATEFQDGAPVGVERTRETGAVEYNAFTVTCVASAGTFYPGEPVMLLGDDTQRSRALISNTHESDTLLIGTLDQISAGQGFMLPPFNVFDPQVQGAIYACVPATGIQNIAVGVWIERN